jgi:hypothetical protein
MMNLRYSKWTTSWTAAANVFGSSFTATDVENWGACAVSQSDIHAVALSDNGATGTYLHARHNGTTFSAGNTIGSLSYATNSGIALASDSTNVWAFVIDSSKNIQYNKWTASGLSWGGWNVLEATRANTPSNIIAAYSAADSKIMVAWSEVNGSNWDVIGSTLSTGSAPATRFRRNLSLRAGSRGVA